jgi:hypothetical protein
VIQDRDDSRNKRILAEAEDTQGAGGALPGRALAGSGDHRRHGLLSHIAELASRSDHRLVGEHNAHSCCQRAVSTLQAGDLIGDHHARYMPHAYTAEDRGGAQAAPPA